MQSCNTKIILHSQLLKTNLFSYFQAGIAQWSCTRLQSELPGFDSRSLLQYSSRGSLNWLGKKVNILIKDIDRYKRTVGIVYYNNNTINGLLVLNGFAWIYEKYCTDKYFYNIWIKLEQSAKSNKMNIWSSKNPIAPWDYRRGKR